MLPFGRRRARRVDFMGTRYPKKSDRARNQRCNDDVMENGCVACDILFTLVNRMGISEVWVCTYVH